LHLQNSAPFWFVGSGKIVDHQKLDQPQDLSPLTNPNFVAQALTRMGDTAKQSCEKVQGKPWPGLGRRVEVMSLPTGGVEREMGRMSI